MIKEMIIEYIEKVEDSFGGSHHKAVIGEIRGHGACIEVIGVSVTDCVERSMIIIKAFREPSKNGN